MIARIAVLLGAVFVSLTVAAAAPAAETEGEFVPFGSGFDDVVKLRSSPLGTGAVAVGLRETDQGQVAIFRAYTKSGREDFEWGDGGEARVPCEGSNRVPALAAGPRGSLFVLCDDRISRLSSTGSVDGGFGDGGATEVRHPLEDESDPSFFYDSVASRITVAGDKLFVAGTVGRYPDPRPLIRPWLARYELTGGVDESYGEAGFRTEDRSGYCIGQQLDATKADRVIAASSAAAYGCSEGGSLTITDWGVLGEGGPTTDTRGGSADFDPQLMDFSLLGGSNPVLLSRSASDGTFALSDADRFRPVDLGAPGQDVALTPAGRANVVGVGVAAQGLDMRAFNSRLRLKSQVDVPLPDGWTVSVSDLVRLGKRYLVAGYATDNGNQGGFAARVKAKAVDPR